MTNFKDRDDKIEEPLTVPYAIAAAVMNTTDTMKFDYHEAQRKLCLEKGWPMFAHNVCGNCGKSWTTKYTLEQAGKTHVVSCPHCWHSWCD